METIKSYTDLEQSNTLAKILPHESADMYYAYYHNPISGASYYEEYPIFHIPMNKSKALPCWSLASLLEILDYPQLSKDKLGSIKVGWMVSVYTNDCRYDSCWHDNPVDACYEIIIKLKELNLL